MKREEKVSKKQEIVSGVFTALIFGAGTVAGYNIAKEAKKLLNKEVEAKGQVVAQPAVINAEYDELMRKIDDLKRRMKNTPPEDVEESS